ncbi:tRNA dihydrouridine synthase [Oceanidesulfovibrio indonesiensis]|uniref:tRNA dihydrouridine synthase n=1 Tax=Oceanidesulfovibrio indonesiensis TaxID=54767 RepID=UPI001F289DEB|nr:tRNA-dihydrouridine synthase family protein [Oceanidesulfovibrio indonesiensis]
MSSSTEQHLPIGVDSPWLAPLAGYSDLAFRLLCREQGAAVACTEMVSAKGLAYRSPGTAPLLETCPQDSPLVVQLFGAEEEFLVRGVAELSGRGFAWFDLNAGCPVPKVVKTGAGAGMIRTVEDRANLAAITRAMVREAGEGRVGVKFRMGFHAADDTAVETALLLQDAGAAWLTIHPRYARQGYAGVSRWEVTRKVVESVSIPVIASGDLFSAEDAHRCVAETGVSGVMFARGALRDPLVFAKYLGRMNEEPDRNALAALVRRHAELCRTYGDQHRSLLKMRTFVPRYVKNLEDASNLRKRLIACKTWSCIEEVAAAIDGSAPVKTAGEPSDQKE